MHDQLNDYFKKILSICQCGFKEGFSTQHCLLARIKKTTKKSWQWGVFSCFFIDLTTDFDFLLYVLLIVKLKVYGIKKGSLTLLFSYIKNRKQRVRLNNTHGSIVGPLLLDTKNFKCSNQIREYTVAMVQR